VTAQSRTIVSVAFAAGITVSAIARADAQECPACAEPVAQSTASGGPVEQPLIPVPEPRVPGVLLPNRLRFALAGFGGAMLLPRADGTVAIGGVGDAIEFGRRIGESGEASFSIFGAVSFATVLYMTDARAALFIEYAHADEFGIAAGAASGLCVLSLFGGADAVPYVGIPLRLTWYAPASRGEHLHSVFVTAEFEPDILILAGGPNNQAFRFHAFGSVGYVIH
jgi:hypothetical protein